MSEETTQPKERKPISKRNFRLDVNGPNGRYVTMSVNVEGTEITFREHGRRRKAVVKAQHMVDLVYNLTSKQPELFVYMSEV